MPFSENASVYLVETWMKKIDASSEGLDQTLSVSIASVSVHIKKIQSKSPIISSVCWDHRICAIKIVLKLKVLL